MISNLCYDPPMFFMGIHIPMKRIVSFSLGIFLLFVSSGAVLGYQEMDVKEGGSVQGTVILKGPIPPPRVFPLVLYPFGSFCKKISDGRGHILLDEFLVGSGNGLQDVVITIQNVKSGKPFPGSDVELESVDCMFHPASVSWDEQYRTDERGVLHHAHPLVEVYRNPQSISVFNKDPILHNGQVFQSEKGNIVLNFPLPVSNDPRGGMISLDPGKRITQMICGMHEFMQTWGYAVDNPYYAKTKSDGTFLIDKVPPGTYRVVAWHPHLRAIEQWVTVGENGVVSVNFEFDGKQVKRPEYESQEKFRIGPESRPHEHLEGCEEPYCSGSPPPKTIQLQTP